MVSDITGNVIVSVVAALFGGVLVALVNNAYMRGINRATEEKVKAEAEKTRAEAEEIRFRLHAQQEDIDVMILIVTRLISKYDLN